jgi:hypothetical protein
MRIYKQNEIDMSVKDITFNYKIKNVLAGLFLSTLIIVVLSSFIPIKQNFIYKEVIVHDTIKELIVLKHGLTEITVDRNANIPTFCNNPGALRPSSIKEVNNLAIGTIQAPSGEFLHFANEQHGYKALEIVLRKVYWNTTIKDCISRYAPSFENDTDGYVGKIVSKMGISSNTLVKNCNIKKLMKTIAEIEGFKQK